MQKEGFDFTETYARLTTVWTLLAAVDHKDYIIQQMNVKSAFLRGSVEENVYTEMPVGFANAVKIAKLNKASCGLKQAPYCWNKKKENLAKSENDPCLYIKFISNKAVLYQLLNIDGIILVSNDQDTILEPNRDFNNNLRCRILET